MRGNAMKFRDAVHAYFKAQGLSDEELLKKMQALDHGKQTRFFDKLDLDADTTTAQKNLLGIIQIGKNKNIFEAIVKGEKPKVFSAFQAVDRQLTESPEWKNFWAERNSPEDLMLKQNLIDAYRFAIIQNLYISLMSQPDKKLIEKLKKSVEAVGKINDEYARSDKQPSTQPNLSDSDPIIQELDDYIAEKSKPGTLQRVKTLGRNRGSIIQKSPESNTGFGETLPAPILTARYLSSHDQGKIKIAEELKVLLKNPLKDTQEMLSKIDSLNERYTKIRGSSTSKIQQCLDEAKKRYTPKAELKQ